MNRGSRGAAASGDAGPRRASMRPRFMNRGSHGVIVDQSVPSRASMRPRFMNRGSARRELATAMEAALQ